MYQEDLHVLFDYCVSNPPYQMDKSTGKNNSADNIFHLFYQYGIDFTHQVIMIFPGGRWMQRSSRGNKAAHVIYPTVNTIDWYPNGDEKNITKVFSGIRIPDGVCIVTGSSNAVTDSDILLNGIHFERPDDQGILPLTCWMSRVAYRILQQYDDRAVHHKQPVTLFDVPTYYSEKNPDKACILEDTASKNMMDDPIVAYIANSNRGTSKRVDPHWLESSAVDWDDKRLDAFHTYKVCVAQAGAGKDPANTAYYSIDKDTVIGNSWVVVGMFDTKQEADNYRNYVDTKTVRALLNESKGGKSKKWGYFVPYLEDYTSRNPHIDWDKPLDPQLYKLFNLTEEEINTIEDN